MNRRVSRGVIRGGGVDLQDGVIDEKAEIVRPALTGGRFIFN